MLNAGRLRSRVRRGGSRSGNWFIRSVFAAVNVEGVVDEFDNGGVF
jgi:hypothetical protein